MADAIDELITRVIQREGAYVNHPADRGGPTKFGITQATLASWRGGPVSDLQVQALSEAEARDIYRGVYFRGLEEVKDPKVLEFLFDYAVNSGPARALKALMVVLGAQKLGEVDQATIFWPLIAERLDNFLRIVGRDPSQAVFAEGWANRVAEWWRPAGAPGSTASAPGILRKGDTGPDVLALQRALGVTPDGAFGPKTDAAVRLFQADQGLVVDGIVGTLTRRALGI